MYLKKITEELRKIVFVILTLVFVIGIVSNSTTEVKASIASEAKDARIGSTLKGSYNNGETKSYKITIDSKTKITISGSFLSNYNQDIYMYKKMGRWFGRIGQRMGIGHIIQ